MAVETMKNSYLMRKATPWVSYFFLIGCIAITAGLVYASDKATDIGDKWSIVKSSF
jgi:hypothetical protein